MFGDFGVAVCGPRFRVFQINNQGMAIKARFEAREQILTVIKKIKQLELVHISGSAALAKKAIIKKLTSIKEIDISGIF